MRKRCAECGSAAEDDAVRCETSPAASVVTIWLRQATRIKNSAAMKWD